MEIGAEILVRIGREFKNSIEGRLTDSGSLNMARHTSIGDAYRNRKDRARPNFILAQHHQIRGPWKELHRRLAGLWLGKPQA